jgi:hypothetical protein
LGGSTTTFPAAYATGAAAVTQAVGNTAFAPQPSSTVAGSAKYNPDVMAASFWSNMNGFTMTTVNATTMKIDYYLVNCTMQAWGVPCSPVPIGPVYTLYRPAKTPAVPTGTAQAFYVALAGVNASNFATLTSKTAFVAAVALTVAVPANSIVFTGTSPGPSSSLVVAFTIYSVVPYTVANLVSSALAAPSTLLANINAGLASCNIAATVSSAAFAPSPPPPSPSPPTPLPPSPSPPPPSPPPPSPPPPNPPPFSTTAAPVYLAASLSGYTVATFTAAHQTAFVSGVALALNVNSTAVTITSVTAAASAGRHLSQSGVTVAFTVLTTSAPATTSTLLASALPAALTTSFTAAALPVPAVAGISAVAPPAASAGFKAGALLAAMLAAATALLL